MCIRDRWKKGPFTIAPGGQREIPFRNVFAKAMDFSFTCDNPAFTIVSGDRQNVPPKTSKSVTIKFSPLEVRCLYDAMGCDATRLLVKRGCL